MISPVLLPLASFVALALSQDASSKPYPVTLKDLLMVDPSATSGADVPSSNAILSGCVNKSGSACRDYSLPMAQAFTALANAGQCGPNKNLKYWTCAECKKAGFDVVPESVNVVTGPEISQGQSTSIYVAQVKGNFPGNRPRPAEALKHTGEDCWHHCRQTEGYCDWCGVGNSCISQTRNSYQCAKPSVAQVIHAEVKEGSSENTFGCVLSVRGSKNVDNWIMDLVFPLEDMKFGDQCPGCKGVAGWLTIWHKIESKVMSALTNLGCVPGSSRGNLLVTGHSLGAAVSTLGMFHLQRKGYNVVQSYNFEGPRVGNKAWSAAFETAFGRDVPMFRVTHSADVVVRLPPQLEILHLGLDYMHVASEVFFPGEDKNTNVVCETAEDRSCADRNLWLPSLITELSRGFKDHCTGPLGEHGDFCHCPAGSSLEASPQQPSYVI